MKDEEEYLDRLLQAALNKGKAAEPEETEPGEAESSFDAAETLKSLSSDTPKKDISSGALPSFRQVVDAEEKGEDLAESFRQTEELPEAAEIPELADVSDVMSLFGEETAEEAPAYEEPEYTEEAPAYEESEYTEEAPAYEEPEYTEEAPAYEESEYTEEAPAYEEPEYTEEAPVYEEPEYTDEAPTYDDPERELTADEIAAMYAAEPVTLLPQT